MLLPSGAVVVLAKARNESLHVRWTSFHLPVALFLIPGVLHAVMLPTMATLEGGVRWQDWLTRHSDGSPILEQLSGQTCGLIQQWSGSN